MRKDRRRHNGIGALMNTLDLFASGATPHDRMKSKMIIVTAAMGVVMAEHLRDHPTTDGEIQQLADQLADMIKDAAIAAMTSERD